MNIGLLIPIKWVGFISFGQSVLPAQSSLQILKKILQVFNPH